jgi:hypothetical protein
MACCGKKRAEASAHYRSWQRIPENVALFVEKNEETVALQHTGASLLSLRGPSGRVYTLSEVGAPLIVDPKDVDALLATRLFSRVSL